MMLARWSPKSARSYVVCSRIPAPRTQPRSARLLARMRLLTPKEESSNSASAASAGASANAVGPSSPPHSQHPAQPRSALDEDREDQEEQENDPLRSMAGFRSSGYRSRRKKAPLWEELEP